MKILYVNTYPIELEKEQYLEYCNEFAEKAGLTVSEYNSLFDMDINDEIDENGGAVESDDFIDGSNNDANGLELWDKFCAGWTVEELVNWVNQ